MRNKQEYDLQCQIVEWFNLQYPELADKLHHSPNGEVRPSKTYINKRGETKRYCPSGQRLKKMGTKAGFPDLVLFHHREVWDSSQRIRYFYCGLAFDMKRPGEKLSKEQDNWMKDLSRSGFFTPTFIVDTFEKAVSLINVYLR